MTKNKLLVPLFIIPIVLLLFFILFSTSQIVPFLDILFYLGLVLLVIGSVLLIIQEGFFTAFLKNSRRFFSAVNKREQAIQHGEGKGGEAGTYIKRFPFLTSLLSLGGYYFVLSVAASFVVVYFGR